MDEDALKASIAGYKSQLQQVEEAIAASDTHSAELIQLRDDLRELISLTEGSLLSLKKSLLLASLTGEAARNQVSDNAAKTSFDNAYAKPVCGTDEEAADGTGSSDESSSSESSLDSSSVSESGSSCEETTASADSSIIGTCCQAPHAPEWGAFGYHAAAIIGLEGVCEESGEPKVRVMFLYPTQPSMVICPFFLSGTCRYGDTDSGECRQSHGEVTKISSLREFVELTEYGPLSVGDRCLARYDDGVWYKGVIVDVHHDDEGGEDTWQVMFDGYEREEDTRVLAGQHVIPVQGEDPGDSTPEEKGADNQNEVPHGNSATAAADTASDTLGCSSAALQNDGSNWEAHTRGIASKLMSKMGYISGRGLGRDMQGRVEPVPILRLPKGKSLDKIMQLKERMGTMDAFDVLKQLQKRKGGSGILDGSAAGAKRPRHGVFDFLNHTFSASKKIRPSEISVKGHLKRDHKVKEISRLELTKKSDKTLNVQLLKTDEEMKMVRRKIIALGQRLSCNEGRDQKTTRQLKEKLSEAQSYLDRLQHSEQIMQHHQKERQNRKKMSIF